MEALSEDLLLHVFANFKPHELIKNVMLVCKAWRKLAWSCQLWREVTLSGSFAESAVETLKARLAQPEIRILNLAIPLFPSHALPNLLSELFRFAHTLSSLRIHSGCTTYSTSTALRAAHESAVRCPTLTSLHLSTEIGFPSLGKEVSTFVRRLTSLTDLGLKLADVDQDSDAIVAAVMMLTKLQSLSIYLPGPKSAPESLILKIASACPNLAALRITAGRSESDRMDLTAVHLQRLLGLRKLRDIKLSGFLVSEEVLKIACRSQLEHVDVAPSEFLLLNPAISGCSVLRSLTLKCSGYTFSLNDCPSLHSLDLSIINPCHGAPVSIHLSRCPALSSLSFYPDCSPIRLCPSSKIPSMTSLACSTYHATPLLSLLPSSLRRLRLVVLTPGPKTRPLPVNVQALTTSLPLLSEVFISHISPSHSAFSMPFCGCSCKG